ncbi:MAG: ABC transporter permease, partial [Thermoanaerobaculia bacterium]|nr:ABC transporter permease [Thermoanaerobaculia bacterium]
MKFRTVFRFELAYRGRRVSTWLYAAALLFIAFSSIRGNYLPDARNGEFLLNSPFVIAATTVLSSLVWLLLAASVAGDAAARDIRTRMHPLIHTAPISKAEYLGGRFLAAFTLNALLLLTVPTGILLAVLLPGVEPEILGPFWPATYITAYLIIALPTAFAGTTIQFSLAVLNRRAGASYFGSVLLFLTAYVVAPAVAVGLGLRGLGKMLDPVGIVNVVSVLSDAWTPIEKNTRLVGLEASLVANRSLWIGIALCILAWTYRRFRFGHPVGEPWWGRAKRLRDLQTSTADSGIARSSPISLPHIRRTFGFATHVRQTVTIARASFRTIVKSRSGFIFFAVIAMLTGLFLIGQMKFMGVPLTARAEHILRILTTPGPGPGILILLLIVFWAGGLIWREREAGVSEITDAAPVPEWVFFSGKFLGLGLVLVTCMALTTTIGLLVQKSMGHPHLELGLYLQILLGLQLTDYLLLASFALGVHVLVNHKHVGQLALLLAMFGMLYARQNSFGHNLLLPGSDPGWSYTDMRGFGPFLEPWAWFKLYWAAWALLLAVAAKLFWSRGRGGSIGARIQVARHRITRPTVWALA